MGRALEEVVATDLSRTRELTVVRAVRMHALDVAFGLRPISAPGISAERQAAIAAGAGWIGYGTYTVVGGRLQASLAIEDLGARRLTRTLTASGAPGDAIGVGSALAARYDSQAGAFSTPSEAALKDYSQAMEVPGLEQAGPLLEAAIAADANFGPAYRMLAELQLQRQDRAAAVATLQRAVERGESIAPAERARLAADLAGLENQPQLRLRALDAVVKFEPGDVASWQALASLAMNRRQFAQSVAAYRRLLDREPEDFNSWNALAYAAAYAGDWATARDAAHHYAAIRPNELNPYDSLGDAAMLCGRFHDAEEAYLQAARRDPGFRNNGEFYKAAMAHLWTGDIAGADTLAGKYFQARAAANDPLLELRRIEWTWFTGARREACRRMETLARGSLSDVAPRAWAELAVWDLMLGDDAAARAAAVALGPQSGGIATVIHFLLQPPGASAEWTERAERVFPAGQQAGVRNVSLTAALLLAGEFAPAADLLQHAVEAGGPQPEETSTVLLAWADIEAGRAQAAAPFLKVTPAPAFTGPDAFLSFSFPRLFYLRGEEAARQGKRDEARANYRLFLQLSGPDPLKWGEEAKAKAAL